jgi:hypothetical protein
MKKENPHVRPGEHRATKKSSAPYPRRRMSSDPWLEPKFDLLSYLGTGTKATPTANVTISALN